VHVRYVCIALSILSYFIHALHSVWGTIYFIPIFSLVILRSFCRYFWGWQLKHVGRLLLCLGISKPLSMWIGLVLSYMLGLDVFSFLSMCLLFFCLSVFKKKKLKKKWGEFAGFSISWLIRYCMYPYMISLFCEH
jgi:hypothetical protein